MSIRLIHLTLSMVALASAVCAQTTHTGQIANLMTTRQVQEFVRSRDVKYNNYKEFRLTDSLDTRCTGLLTCLKPARTSSWVKADFDSDGRIDLLVSGYGSKYFGDRKVICFLDKGKAGLKELFLADEYDCVVPQLGYVKGKAIIRYAHSQIEGARFAKNRKWVCRLDTLIFRNTSFVEYNRAPRDYTIEKVAFSTTECFGSCPIFDLQLSRDGAATYHAEEYNEKKGDFTSRIKAQSLAEIWTLLNYLDFPKLQNNYSIAATDHSTCTLTITYGGGKVKTIRDYGEQGTFGLSQLYQLLFALRTTQAWK